MANLMTDFNSLAIIMTFGQIAAVIALLNGFLTTIGQAKIAVAAVESIARQPEARASITSTMFIGLAMAETSGIYGLLIAFLMLFLNPVAHLYVDLVERLAGM